MNMYKATNNSGIPQYDGPNGRHGQGTLLPGNLEMSNVDLAEEFTDMIVTQRGHQANARTIRTSDEMLQELAQLKR
jgi:flagellar hook protein FlgE